MELEGILNYTLEQLEVITQEVIPPAAKEIQEVIDSILYDAQTLLM